MDIITTLYPQELIIQNKCQILFLDKLALKQDVDKTFMINIITCSMLGSPTTSDYDNMDKDVYK